MQLVAAHSTRLIVAFMVLLTVGLAFLPVFSPKDRPGRRPSWLEAVGSARGAVVFLGSVVAIRLLAGMWFAGSEDAARPLWSQLADAVVAGGLAAVLVRLVDGVEGVVLRRVDLEASDNLHARVLVTQARVLSRTVQTAVVVIGLGVILMSFEGARKLGASLLASAGIASLAIGLAARPTLENLIAGVQIALTQPVRLDDVVIVEDEWGRVEEIAATYVVIRIWDDRRLIVPLRYFLENAFENWTRRTANLLGTVFVRCAFEVSVDQVRKELRRVCEESGHWDGRVAIVQVTEAAESSVQLRALVSASNSSHLWDLRVEVREALVGYLRRESASSVPRSRVRVTGILPEGDREEVPLP